MSLKTKFTLIFNDVIFGGEYDHYPSEAEIESAIKERFPQGFIYDQFADERILIEAQVKKIYTLEEIE